jgi:hypothetical protein
LRERAGRGDFKVSPAIVLPSCHHVPHTASLSTAAVYRASRSGIKPFFTLVISARIEIAISGGLSQTYGFWLIQIY